MIRVADYICLTKLKSDPHENLYPSVTASLAPAVSQLTVCLRVSGGAVTPVCVLMCILVCLLLPRRGPADSSRARHYEAASLACESAEITLHHSKPGWTAEEMHRAAKAAYATAETG